MEKDVFLLSKESLIELFGYSIESVDQWIAEKNPKVFVESVEKLLITKTDLSKILGCSTERIDEWVLEKKLRVFVNPSSCRGNFVERFYMGEVKLFIERNLKYKTSDAPSITKKRVK